jgi:hypothetical protein
MALSLVRHLPVVLFSLPALLGAQVPQWRLVEDLRIGSDANPMTTWAAIRGMIEGADGRILVLESRPQEIRVFDRNGRFLSLAARRGQGPGELMMATGMVRAGETIWVNDPGNARLSAFSAVDGRYIRQIGLPNEGFSFFWNAAADGAERIVESISVPTTRMDPATNRPVLEQKVRRIRVDGSVVMDTIRGSECTQRIAPSMTSFSSTMADSPIGVFVEIPFQAKPVTRYDGRGGYWCTPNDAYLITHRSLATGDTLHTVRKPYTRLPVPSAQRDSSIESVKKSLARYPVLKADFSLVPNTYPVFQRLDVDDMGRVWARRFTQQGSPSEYDLFDLTGRAVATVTTTLNFSAFLGLHIRGDNVYGVVHDADNVQHLVRARIVKGG